MAGVSHDVLLLALKQNPELLGELLHRVAGVTLPGPIEVGDSAVKFAVSLEKYPDLLFTTPSPSLDQPHASPETAGAPLSRWTMVELQNRKDETKSRSWHLSTSVLLQAHGMGDLIVITASRSVARWATKVAQHRGALGTVKGLTPVVLYLSPKEIDKLLDPACPQLALFAVWALGRASGEAARTVVNRALEVTESLPVELQEAQSRAIMAMLSERLLRFLKEMSMDVNQIKETRASRALRLFFENRGRKEGIAEGEALGEARGISAGKREALLSVLAVRGLSPDEGERAQIASLEDADLLDRCIQKAVTASTVAEVLDAARKRSSGRGTSRNAPRGTPGKGARASNGHKKKVNGHHP